MAQEARTLDGSGQVPSYAFPGGATTLADLFGTTRGSPVGRKAKGTGGRRKARDTDAVRGRVRAHDPFELIRWLALSQTDPRKALAELVQNSLDAGATRVRITREREKGVVCIRIVDDGEGPIPEKERPEALTFIATNIGHSRKRSLSPQERLQLMTQGQYGIGLLGFWAIGEKLEMRSVLPGQKPHRLVLHRDSPDFVIEALRGRLELDEKRTEVVVVGVHPEVQSALNGRRISEYLASELRGQLLARTVLLEVEDRISRGRSQKWFEVAPRRFLGRPIDAVRTVAVPGHSPAQVELFYLGDDVSEEAAVPIALYAAGTLAAESFHGLSEFGLDRFPWTDRRFTGFVDFPGFTIAPGSRRGVRVDAAAEAFAQAIVSVEAVLRAVLDERERARAVEQDRNLIKNLQRAFRDFYRHRPRFELFPVSAPGGGAGPGVGDGTGGSLSQVDPDADPGRNGSGIPDEGDLGRPSALETSLGEDEGAEAIADGVAASTSSRGDEASVPEPSRQDSEDRSAEPIEEKLFLLPPGPLTAVRFTPKTLRVPVQSEKSVRVEGIDATGRIVRELMEFTWRVESPGTNIVESGRSEHISITESGTDEIQIRAGQETGRGRIIVDVRTVNESTHGELDLRVTEGGASRSEGIPEPEFLDAPGASWRSRMESGRWQVNSGHPDFRRTGDRPAVRLRYLAMLFAKEIVLRSSRDPRMEEALEQMVEVSSFADRNLSGRREQE